MKKHSVSRIFIRFLRRYSLRTRLILLLIVFAVLPLQLVFSLANHFLTDIFVQSQYSYWEVSQMVIENNLYNVFKQADACFYSVLRDNTVFNTLNQAQNERGDLEYLETKLKKLVQSNGMISNISIVMNNDRMLSAEDSVLPLRCDMLSEVQSAPIFMQIPTADMKEEQSVQVRTLIDFSSGISYGYMIVYFDNRSIDRCCSEVISENDQCVILDGTGKLISEGDRTEKNGALSLFQNSRQSGMVNTGESTYYVKKLSIPYAPVLDWYMICSYSNREMNQNLARLNWFLTLAELFILAVAAFVILKVTASTTRALREFSKTMEGYTFGRESQKLVEIAEPHDELYFLEKTMYDMMHRIDRLMVEAEEKQKRQRELELDIMQAQINPHFLYNTIDSISCVALRDGQVEIRRVAVALSKFFRISLSNGNKYVSVQDELNHIRYYIQIEQFVLNNTFNVTYDIEEDILDKKIIKIVLEPLVENAIRHGLKEKKGIGHIRIAGFILDGKLHFEVTDDGVGFDTGILEDQEHKCFGYHNVNQRVRLEYGEGYGLSYYSDPGHFTRAELVMGYFEEK